MLKRGLCVCFEIWELCSHVNDNSLACEISVIKRFSLEYIGPVHNKTCQTILGSDQWEFLQSESFLDLSYWYNLRLVDSSYNWQRLWSGCIDPPEQADQCIWCVWSPGDFAVHWLIWALTWCGQECSPEQNSHWF